MGTKWTQYRLGDITSWTSGGTPSKSKDEYWNGDIPWISASSMDGNRYSNSKLKITDIGLENGSRIAEKDSILLLVRGSILHQKIQVGIAERDVAFNQDVKALKVDTDVVEPWYLLFWFMSIQTKLLGLVENTGIGAGKLDTNILQNLTIDIPEKSYRQKILIFSQALDNKIALNRQINTTLESMAQALFKSWFVDFDPVIDNALAAGNEIPDAFQKRAAARAARREALRQQTNKTTEATDADSPEQALPDTGLSDQCLPSEIQQLFPDRFVLTEEMGWVPEGWEIKPLSDVVSDIIDHRGKTPKKLGGDWVEAGYPAISAKNIKSGKLIRPDAIRFIDEELYRKWMKVPLSKGDIILTSEAPLGEMYFLAEEKEYVLSQRLFGIRADSDYISGCYLYFWLDSPLAKSDLETRATGTTVVGIRQAELQKVLVLSPGKALSDEFSKLALDWMGRANKSEQQITLLSNLRDSLLPKLLSGQITIPDAEQQLAEVL